MTEAEDAVQEAVSMAALLLLERLSPLERAVFVLREVFGFGFPEIASAVDRSKAACRQLAARARRHMDAGRPRFEADRREREELATRFFDALRDGDIDRLRVLLGADVEMVADGGGKAPVLPRSVFGADNVARVLASVFPLLIKIDARVEPRALNGQPGAIVRDRDGKVVGTLTLDLLGGHIQTIRSVANPDKLEHVGPRGGRLGDCPRGEADAPARRLTLRTHLELSGAAVRSCTNWLAEGSTTGGCRFRIVYTASDRTRALGDRTPGLHRL